MLFYSKKRTTANGRFVWAQLQQAFESGRTFQKKKSLLSSCQMALGGQLAITLAVFSLGSILPTTSQAADVPIDNACTNPTKTAKRNGGEIIRWGSGDSWIPAGVPTESDVVLIPGGATVSISPIRLIAK